MAVQGSAVLDVHHHLCGEWGMGGGGEGKGEGRGGGRRRGSEEVKEERSKREVGGGRKRGEEGKERSE